MNNELKYQIVKDFILAKIKKRELKSGDLAPSERELSKKFNISQSTVVRALRELVQSEVLYRIQGKGTFIVDQSNNKPKTIGMLLPEKSTVSQLTFFERMKYLMTELNNYGYTLNFFMITENITQEKICNKILKDSAASGIIMFESEELEKSINIFKKENYPYMVLYDTGLDEDIEAVTIDNEYGAYEATKYLIGLGHKKIGMIMGPLHIWCYKQRMLGYKKALKEAGIELDENLIKVTLIGGSEGGYIAMLELLKMKNSPSAVFCCSDFKAVGAMEALKDKNLSIPKDISIVGFDGLEFSKQLKPPLTTMQTPFAEISKEGIKMLIEWITGKKQKTYKKILKSNLIIRESARRKE